MRSRAATSRPSAGALFPSHGGRTRGDG
jgi:hypothetical protein